MSIHGKEHDKMSYAYSAWAERLDGYTPDKPGFATVRCKIHGDKNPSMSVKLDNGFMRCFGCDWQGWPDQYCEQTGEITIGLPTKSQPRPQRQQRAPLPDPEAEYVYTTAEGRNVLKVVRFPGKEFRQFRWDAGAWKAGTKDNAGRPIARVPYNLPAIHATDGPVLWCEGEKDCDNATRLGLLATTSPQGVRSFGLVDPKTLAVFAGRHVTIVPDNDPEGASYARTVGTALRKAGATVHLLTLPGVPHKGDLSDWLAAGGTREQLEQLIALAPIQEASDDPEDPAEDDRPMVVANGRELHEVTNDALSALEAANQAAIQKASGPQLYQRSGLLTRFRHLPPVGSPAGKLIPVLETMGQDATCGLLSRVARWRKLKTNKEGEQWYEPCKPDKDVVKDLLALPEWPLPQLEGIVQTPVFSASGRLLWDPGYHPDAHLFYHADPDLRVPRVPEKPTQAQVNAARTLLCDELVGQFPFTEEASRAHAVAALLLPFCRLMVNGPTPLHLATAPEPGTGKSLLLGLVALLATGSDPDMFPETQQEDEWRKKLTSTLARAPVCLMIDNLKQGLDSSILASVLTARIWQDRILGMSKDITLPIQCVWLATGNNPTLTTEIARRSALIRLDAKQPKPWLRTGFKHENLPGWALTHRAQLVHACLTLVQAWVAVGQPAGQRSLGSYESWSAVMGGILENAGIPGFLGNLDALYDQADRLTGEWADFYAAWYSRFGGASATLGELYGLLNENPDLLLGIVNGSSERAQRTSLGKALSRQVDRRVRIQQEEGSATFRVIFAGADRNGSRSFKLDFVEEHDNNSAEHRAVCGTSAEHPKTDVPHLAGPAGSHSGDPAEHAEHFSDPPHMRTDAHARMDARAHMGSDSQKSSASPARSADPIAEPSQSAEHRAERLDRCSADSPAWPTEPCGRCNGTRYWRLKGDHTCFCTSCRPPRRKDVEFSPEQDEEGKDYD